MSKSVTVVSAFLALVAGAAVVFGAAKVVADAPSPFVENKELAEMRRRGLKRPPDVVVPTVKAMSAMEPLRLEASVEFDKHGVPSIMLSAQPDSDCTNFVPDWYSLRVSSFHTVGEPLSKLVEWCVPAKQDAIPRPAEIAGYWHDLTETVSEGEALFLRYVAPDGKRRALRAAALAACPEDETARCGASIVIEEGPDDEVVLIPDPVNGFRMLQFSREPLPVFMEEEDEYPDGEEDEADREDEDEEDEEYDEEGDDEENVAEEFPETAQHGANGYFVF